MSRTSVVCAMLLVGGSGCTITTHTGGKAASPAPERAASDPEHRQRERRPHTRARPKRADRAEPSDPQPQPEAEPKPRRPLARPSLKPEPRSTKPIETTRPEPKPTPKPEPQPEAKPPTEPAVKPKPRPKPKPKPEPEEQGVRDFVFGAPAGLKPGLPDAFWVYQDEQGWHLRTTTDDKKVLRKFTGRIWISEGAFSDAKPSRLEQGQDSVKSTTRTIRFTFDTMGVMDGVDWKLAGGRCTHFELIYEGKPEAKVIHLGAKKVSPPSNIFLVCGR